MDTTTMLGFAAGTLTTIAFVPQFLKTWRSRSAQDVSLGMLVTFWAGVLCWLVYGFLIHSQPVILANAITLILTGAILVLKMKYR